MVMVKRHVPDRNLAQVTKIKLQYIDLKSINVL